MEMIELYIDEGILVNADQILSIDVEFSDEHGDGTSFVVFVMVNGVRYREMWTRHQDAKARQRRFMEVFGSREHLEPKI
jgi:hypothetical protein